MFFNSWGIRIAAHEPFTTIEDAVRNERDITSHAMQVATFPKRVMVSDIDTGVELQGRIEDLKNLLAAYRSGLIKPDPSRKRP